MAGRFSYSSPGGRIDRPWFRVGNYDVGSAALMAGICAVGLLIYSLEGATHPITRWLTMAPSEVLGGQVWRIVTWPIPNPPSLFGFIGIVLLGYIGGELETRTGRTAMATLLIGTTVLTGVAGTLLSVSMFGVDSVEFVVLLVFIAEYPNVRFFFGIPGWVLGAVFAGIRILQFLSQSAFAPLGVFLLSLLIGAMLARSIGLLSNYDFIPKIPVPASLGGTAKTKPQRPATRRSGSAPTRNHRGQVIDGPWSPPTGATSVDIAAAQAELDQLLDKISADGLSSLTDAEKVRLNELSKRLR